MYTSIKKLNLQLSSQKKYEFTALFLNIIRFITSINRLFTQVVWSTGKDNLQYFLIQTYKTRKNNSRLELPWNLFHNICYLWLSKDDWPFFNSDIGRGISENSQRTNHGYRILWLVRMTLVIFLFRYLDSLEIGQANKFLTLATYLCNR